MQIMRNSFLPSDSLSTVVQAFRDTNLDSVESLYIVLHDQRLNCHAHFEFRYDREFHNEQDSRTLLMLSLSIWKLRGSIKEFRLTLTDNDPSLSTLRRYEFCNPTFVSTSNLSYFIRLNKALKK